MCKGSALLGFEPGTHEGTGLTLTKIHCQRIKLFQNARSFCITSLEEYEPDQIQGTNCYVIYCLFLLHIYIYVVHEIQLIIKSLYVFLMFPSHKLFLQYAIISLIILNSQNSTY